MCDQQSLRSACAYAQSDQSLCKSLEYSMTVRLLNEQHLEFLRLKGGCTGVYESTLVKITNLWKSHVTAHICYWDMMATSLTRICTNDTYYLTFILFVHFAPFYSDFMVGSHVFLYEIDCMNSWFLSMNSIFPVELHRFYHFSISFGTILTLYSFAH